MDGSEDIGVEGGVFQLLQDEFVNRAHIPLKHVGEIENGQSPLVNDGEFVKGDAKRTVLSAMICRQH